MEGVGGLYSRRRQEWGYSEFRVLLAFHKIELLERCYDHCCNRLFWLIISETQSVCGKEKSLAITAHCTLINFPSRFGPIWNISPYFTRNSFPSETLASSYFAVNKQCESNFIGHSKLNMACWLAVGALLALLSVSAPRRDDAVCDTAHMKNWET